VGYFYVIGPCWSCGDLFGFNPDRVPSIVVAGQRRQVCRDCIAAANPRRVANGLDPVVPLPGAYEPTQSER
jgi:hypothetical protein